MKTLHISIFLGLFVTVLLGQNPAYMGQPYCDDFNSATFAHTTATWDWRINTAENWMAYVRDGDGGSAVSVYDLPSPFDPSRSQSPTNTYPNIDHLNATGGIDYEPEDGWELVFKALGSPGGYANSVENPTFVMYNRFQGVLRVFVWLTLDLGQTATEAQILTQFKDEEEIASSLLSLIENPALTPETFDTEITASTPNEYSNPDGGTWLFADLPAAYDPCTCSEHLNDQSQYVPNVSEVRVFGSAITTSDFETTDPEGNVQDNYNKDYGSTGASGSATGALIEGGSKFFKATGSLSAAINDQRSITTLAATSPKKSSYTLRTKVPVKLPDWLKFLPYVGDVFAVVDLLSSGGQKLAPPSANVADVTRVEFSGTLKTVGNALGFTFYTPGCPHDQVVNPDDSKVPIYDHILGVFTLMEQPILEYVTYQPANAEVFTCTNGINQTIYSGGYASPIRQYRLKKPLRYAINPASELELIDLNIALEYEIGEVNGGNPVSTSQYVSDNAHMSKLHFFGPVGGFREPLGVSSNAMNYRDRLRNYGIDIAYWPIDDNHPNGVDDITQITYTTGFFPMQCSDQQSVFLGIPATSSVFAEYSYTPEFVLKVRAILRRRDAEATDATEDVVILLSYKVETEAISGGNLYYIKEDPSYANNPNSNFCLAGRPLQFQDYVIDRVTSANGSIGNVPYFPLGNNGLPFDLTLENQTINSPQYALSTITLSNVDFESPDTTYTPPYPGAWPITAPGAPRLIQAGDEIIFGPGSGNAIGNPNVDLSIGLPRIHFGGCEDQPMPLPVDEAYLTSFCRDINRYNPRIEARQASSSGQHPESLPLQALPNPFSDDLTLRFTLEAASDLRVEVLDMSGRVVATPIASARREAGPQELRLTGLELSAGAYLVRMQAGERSYHARVLRN